MCKMFRIHTRTPAVHIEEFGKQPYGGLRTNIERLHERDREGGQELDIKT